MKHTFTLLGFLLFSTMVFAFPPGWTADTQLSNLSGSNAVIDAYNDVNGAISFLWQHQNPNLNTGLFFQRMNITGQLIGQPMAIVSPSDNYFDYSSSADSASNIHIVYSTGTTFNNALYYMKISPFGSMIVPPTQITDGNGIAITASLAVDYSNNAHVIWVDNRDTNSINTAELYYTKINQTGAITFPPSRVTNGLDFVASPTTSIDSLQNLHIIYRRNNLGTPELVHVRIDNNGVQLGMETIISTGYANSPVVKILSNDLFVVYENNTNISFAKLDLDGNTIVSETTVSSTGTANSPKIVFDNNGNGIITWSSRNGNQTTSPRDIYYRTIYSNGVLAVSEQPLTTNGTSHTPTLLLNQQNATVFFTDKRNSPPGFASGEIFFKRTLPSIQVNGSPNIGNTIQFHISDPLHPNAFYAFAGSLSTTPPIQIGNEIIPLAYDWLLQSCVNNPSSVGLSNSSGYFDGNGNATITLQIPNNPAYAGITGYFAFSTMDLNATNPFLGISNPVVVTLLP